MSSDDSESESPNYAGPQSRSEKSTEQSINPDTIAGDNVEKGRKRKRKSQDKEALQDTIALDGKSKEERKKEKREKKENKAMKRQKMLAATQ